MCEEAENSVLRSCTAVREVVEEGVDGFKVKLMQQEELTKGSRDAILEMLVREGVCVLILALGWVFVLIWTFSLPPQDEHKLHLEDVLMAKVMPAVSSVMAVNEGLKRTMQRCNTLAGQVCVFKTWVVT